MITDRQYARDVTAQDIRDLIAERRRETNDLEYKVSPDGDLLKAACGVANGGGGYILVGVDEDEQHCASAVVDIQDSGRVEESIRQKLRDGLAPRPVIEVVPLAVDGATIIVIRISPQNPPHMVSHEKKTDFYGRYDATTERMRYEEIEQRFREKHEAGKLPLVEPSNAVIETIGGRATVSLGAKGALDAYLASVRASKHATLAIVAVSDGNDGSIDEGAAVSILSEPLYRRDGGWLVAHPSLDVDRENGLWVQRYGPASTTTLNPSGDLIFLKPVDEVLCWRQSEAAFGQSPRIYPNALAEYCLSFAYMIADIAARTQPRQILATPIISNATDSHLPMGEGGSVWFDAPLKAPKKLGTSFAAGLVIPIETAGRRPIFARHIAYLIAAQLYSFYGYRENEVAFASDGEIIQESSPEVATLRSIRAYLQNVLALPLNEPVDDFDRSVYWFNTRYHGKPYRLGASEEFVEDHHWSEAKLFQKLAKLNILEAVAEHGPDEYILITNDGLKRLSKQHP